MKNNIIGFSISLLLHIALFVAFFANFKNNFETKQESVSITLNQFVIEENAGQNLDSNEAKSQDEAPQEEEKIEEIVEKEESVEEEVIKEEIIEEKKPAPVIEKPKKVKKVKKEIKKVVKNDTNAQNDGITGENSSAIGSNTMAISGKLQDENILAKIRQIIASYAKEHYPTNAKKRRQQGIVSVEFTYHKNGSVSGLKIVKSSNSSYLDEGALKVIEKTKSRFPKLSDKESMTIKVPIEFKLH
ncbi:MAG: energy transducer TonB [Campylobacter sp.]|nr:energy transducer TonB [Campylobacter sp.]